jgi:putative selenium metabolism hydrolase
VLDVVKLTQDLIRIPSTTGNEGNIIQFIYDKLKPYADKIIVDNKGNLEAKIIFNTNNPTVLFNGHVDTVDPGAMEKPYSGEIIDGEKFDLKEDVVYGRGAADMKSGDAAAISVFSKLKELPDAPNFIAHFVVEEETGKGPGTKFVMENLEEKVDIALSGEPTGLDICLGFRGWVQFQLETYGKTSHASDPDKGINAIISMNYFLNELKKYIIVQEKKVHPFLGKLTCAITNIESSPGRLSVVPDICRLIFDSRYFPDEKPQDREKEIKAILKEIKKNKSDFNANLKMLYGDMRPTFLPPDNYYVQLLKKAFYETKNQKPILRSWRFTADSSYIANNFGIPTVGFGPGFEEVVHTPIEYVPISHLETTVQVYLKFLSLVARNKEY